MIFGKLICFLKGKHKRGKCLPPLKLVDITPGYQLMRESQCPRCGRVKKYKVKKQS